jgi:predicted hydrocarbon binding protein
MMSLRPELGEMMSLVCFKAAIVGVEDTLGEDGAAVVFIRAGKVRGAKVAHQTGLASTKPDLETLVTTLDGVFGKTGTQLCRVVGATSSGEQIVINATETVCSAGESAGSSRKCTYTLGAIWGALEAVMGRTYLGEHTESVLQGAPYDRFVFSPL